MRNRSLVIFLLVIAAVSLSLIIHEGVQPASAATVGPPGAPLNLRASDDLSAFVNLRWVPPSNDGGSPITEYRVYRAESEQGLVSDPTIQIALDAYYRFADRDIPFGVTLFYTVTAVNSYGEGPMSQSVNITILGPPGPPLNVTARWDDGCVVVEWEWPKSTGGLPLDGFLVARGVDGGAMGVIAELGNVTRYEDMDVQRDTTYSYIVVALNTEWIGDEGEMVWVQGSEDGPMWYRDLVLFIIAAVLTLATVWALARWRLGPGAKEGNG